MIHKPRFGPKRWTGLAVLTAASTLVLGLPLASPAVAAASAVTASPAHAGYPVNATATINVTSTGTPSHLSYTVVSGPDGNFPAATACATNTSCSLTNGGTAGTDSVRVFDDVDDSHTFNSGDIAAPDFNVTFAAVPFTVALSPKGTSTATGACQQYTATVADQAGNSAGGYPITVEVTEPNTGTNALATCGTGATTDLSHSTTGGTETYRFTVQTSQDNPGLGTTTFGIQSGLQGTATVTAYYNNGADAPLAAGQPNDSTTQTIGAGGTGAASSLTVTPQTTTQYEGSAVTYSVTVKNAAGQTLPGVQVQYTIPASDPGSTNGNFPNCGGLTPSSGVATCNIPVGAAVGTDHITFFVNQTGGGTPGPDSGEPQQTVTATVQAPPTVSAVTVTCPTPGSTAAATNACQIPPGQNSITFTAHVVSGTSPVSGATVSFAASGSATPTPTSGTATTDADGDAIFTVTTASASAPNAVHVTASIASHSGNADATYTNPVPATFTVTPSVQTVTNGGSPSFTAKVTDTFGNGVAGQVITYVVSGRNSGKTGTATTDSGGTATVSYADAAVTPSEQDAVSFTDTSANAPAPNHVNGTVVYITGSTAASSVVIDVSGAGNGVTCPPASGATKTNTGTPAGSDVPLGSTTPVCAVVKNATGEMLAGKAVTFTVDKGAVDGVGALGASSTKTFTATTNVNGIALVDVTSSASGVQTVTATADAASDTGTIAYKSPAVGDARNITLDPATANITPGGSQQFTTTVADQFGNGVPGITVTFTQSGAGSIGATSSATATTAADGTASVTVSTTASTTGTGSVTATIPSAGTSCSLPVGNPAGTMTAGNCTATSTYTVAATGPSALQLFPESGTKAGGTEQVLVAALNADGSPAANALVQVTVSGANAASGSVTTAANGGAVFSYHAIHAGSDVIRATSGTATATATAKIIRVSEKPRISVSSPHRRWAKVHSETNPSLGHVVMHFYKISPHGNQTLIGSKLTGHGGHATKIFKHLTPGKTYKFRVRVVQDHDIVSHYSKTERQKIRKHNP